MKTMTRPAARTDRPAAARDLPAAVRKHLADRLGRSSQVPLLTWGLAAGSAVAVAFTEPALSPWLLLPVAPAFLLWAAGCGDGRRVMRVFSVATLAAVLFQLAADPPGGVEAAAVSAATVLFLAAVERLAVG